MELQNLYNDYLDNLPFELLADLIINKLSKEGIKLSKRQKSNLTKELKNGNSDLLPLKRWQFWNKKEIEINIEAVEADSIVEKLEKIHDKLPDNLGSMIEEFSKIISNSIISNKKSFVQDHKKFVNERVNHHWKIWKEPFTNLYLLIELSRQAGESMNALYRNKEMEDECKVEVLTRMQARGVQVANEVFTLLINGYPDGAMARWRTLHEITIIAIFINENGNKCAERYLDHDDVVLYKSALQFQKNCEKLGHEPIEKQDLENIEENYKLVIEKYGTEFKDDYGWANPNIKRKATFYIIEQAVDLGHMRPFYKYACDNVHAGPRSLFHKVGLLDNDILLTGPSDYGFAEPGHYTAMSIAMLTVELITLYPTIDSLVAGHIIDDYCGNAIDSFYQAQNNYETEWSDKVQ